MLSFNVLLEIILGILTYGVCISSHITQAPAKVNLRFQVSKFNQQLTNGLVKFSLCIDKNEEKCFWKTVKDMDFNENIYPEIPYEFFINNMDTNLTISIKFEDEITKINFYRKMINLKKIVSKDTFELHSITLENFVKMTVEHECELNYYPPKQCTKFCFPIENEYSCDGFGNKICKEGYYYNSQENKCLENRCFSSNIQCQNNGYCINKGSASECKCLDSYIGKFCENPNPCYPNPCANNGKCFVQNNGGKLYACSCSEGFTGEKCDLRIYQPCICPKNMKCNYSESGELFSCTSENDAGSSNPKPDYSNRKIKQNWKEVSLSTTIVAAVGCMMILISIGVSIYVCHRTRSYSSLKKTSEASQSNFFNSYHPKIVESTFKRSFSLDDNSAYLPINQTVLTNTQGLVTMTPSPGFSVNSNSYQENPAISFINYPYTYNELSKQDSRSGYLMMSRNCTENSNTDSKSLSSGSIPPPPALPPRPTRENESPILPTQNFE